MQSAEIVEKWVVDFSNKEIAVLTRLAYIEQANVYVGGGNRLVVPFNTRAEALDAAESQLKGLLQRVAVQKAIEDGSILDFS